MRSPTDSAIVFIKRVAIRAILKRRLYDAYRGYQGDGGGIGERTQNFQIERIDGCVLELKANRKIPTHSISIVPLSSTILMKQPQY